jgi:hypothetical protein
MTIPSLSLEYVPFDELGVQRVFDYRANLARTLAERGLRVVGHGSFSLIVMPADKPYPTFWWDHPPVL